MQLNTKSILSIDGSSIDLSIFNGKSLLIVNTASNCGFTKQYADLQKISASHDDVAVIGFPCNQFGSQEPKNENEIKEFCSKNYGVTFTMSSKVEVNGPNANEIFVWLKNKVGMENIPWNFTKFLVSADRQNVSVYGPDFSPEDIFK